MLIAHKGLPLDPPAGADFRDLGEDNVYVAEVLDELASEILRDSDYTVFGGARRPEPPAAPDAPVDTPPDTPTEDQTSKKK